MTNKLKGYTDTITVINDAKFLDFAAKTTENSKKTFNKLAKLAKHLKFSTYKKYLFTIV